MELLRKDLNVNEWMSDKDFTQELHGIVATINNNAVGIKFKNMPGNPIFIPENDFQYAMFERRDGGIVQVAVQVECTRNVIGVLLSGPLAGLQFGDKVRLKWDLSQIPLALWVDDIINSQFQQFVVGSSPIPAGATCKFYRCGLNNIRLPVGTSAHRVDGMDSKNVHHEEQNDLEQWVVDPDTKAPIEPYAKKYFELLGISILPKDLPAEKLAEPITKTKEDELAGG